MRYALGVRRACLLGLSLALPSAGLAQDVEPAPATPTESGAIEEPATSADDGLAGLTATELSQLGLTAADMGQKSTFLSAPLEIHGFADFSIVGYVIPEDSPWRAVYFRDASFVFGNFNLYLSKDLTRYLRMFSEVRFTLKKSNASSPEDDLTAGESTDLSYESAWGGLEVERVYLEWTAHRLLAIRLGIFLTPYGIWNVDHGTPAIIPTFRPYVISMELFPERQTGIEAFGSTELGARHTLGYHLTVSNGFNPKSVYKGDFDRNKAVGARAYWRYSGLGNLQLGASGIYGWETESGERPSIDESGDIRFEQVLESQSRILSLAADLRWEYRGLLLQAEFVSRQRAYMERGRVGQANPLLGEYIAPIDRYDWGTYGLIGYRFDWYGVMPYAVISRTDLVYGLLDLRTDVIYWSAGLNIRPIPELVVKLDFTDGYYPNGHLLSDDPLRFISTEFAWAF